MRGKWRKKALAVLLAVSLLGQTVPAWALGAGEIPPPTPDSGDHNEVYALGDNTYRILENSYIACYVDMQDASFTVLPATADLDPDKPGSFAVFTIGDDTYRFGQNVPELDSMLVAPQVRGDLIATDWNIGDYVISQYLAIAEESANENSYAVKVAYAAEYFGEGEAEISARLVLDTLLGPNDDQPLYLNYEDDALDAVTLPFRAQTVTPVPGEAFVQEEAEGPRAYLVPLEAGRPEPESLVLGEFTALASDPDAYVPEGEYADSGALLSFPAQTVSKPEGEADLDSALAVFLTNYGYYGLEEHPLDLEPLPPKEDTPLEDTLENLLGSAAADQAVRLYAESGAAWFEELSCQRPGGDEWIAFGLMGEGTPALPGSKIRFKLAAPPEGVLLQEPRYRYSHIDLEYVDEPFEKGADGYYSFTVPEGGYEQVAFSVGVEPDYEKGYILYRIFCDISEPQVTLIPDFGTSAYELDDGSGNIIAKSGITATLRVVKNGTAKPVFKTATLVFGETGSEALPLKAGTGTFDDQKGELYCAFDVPSDRQGLTQVEIQIEADQAPGPAHVISVDAVLGGEAVDLTLEGAVRANGLYQADAGTDITIHKPGVSGDSNAVLTAWDLTANAALKLKSGGTEKDKWTYGEMPDTLTFTMPGGDVQVRLTEPEYPAVNTQVVVDGGQDEGAPAPNASVTVTRTPKGGEAILQISNFPVQDPNDSGPPKAFYDFSSIVVYPVAADGTKGNGITPHPVRYAQEYKFTVPNSGDYDSLLVELTLAKVPQPKPFHLIEVQQLVGDGMVIGYIEFLTKSHTDGDPSENADSSGAIKAQEGEKVYYNINQLNNPNDKWTVTGAYYLDQNDNRQDLFNGTCSGWQHSFTMPEGPIRVFVEGKKSGTEVHALELQVLAMSKAELDRYGFDHTEKWSVTADLLAAYSLPNNAQLVGENLSQANPTKLTEAGAGTNVYILVKTPRGDELYQGKPVLTDGDGKEIELTDAGFEPRWQGQLFRFVMPDSPVSLTAYLVSHDTVRLTVRPPKGEPDLEIYNANTVHGFQTRTAEGGGETRYFTETVRFQNLSQVHSCGYSLETVDKQAIEGTDATLTVTETSQNPPFTRYYEVTVEWPAAAANPPTLVELPILTTELTYREPVLDAISLDTTSAAKLSQITVTGANLTKDAVKSLALYKAGQEYAVDLNQCIFSPDGASMTVPKAAFPQGLPIAAGAYQLRVGVKDRLEVLFENYEVPYRTAVKSFSFTLNAGDTDYSVPVQYAAVYKVRNAAAYKVLMGENSGSVQPDGLLEDKPVLTLYAPGGFAPSNLSTEDETVTVLKQDGEQSVLVNGNVTLYGENHSGSLFQLRERNGTVTITTDGASVNAKKIPVYYPTDLNSKLTLTLARGTSYSANAPAEGDRSVLPPTFVPNQNSVTLGIEGFEGFLAEIRGYEIREDNLSISGKLWMQIPLFNYPLGGFDLRRLELDLNSQSDTAGFNGLEAEGGFQMPNICGFGGHVYALIDTFHNTYSFDGELNLKIVSVAAKLDLINSKELHGPMVENIYISGEGDPAAGVPLIPPVVVAKFTGLEGGIYNLSSTIDYNHLKNAIPPLEFAIGAKFVVGEVLSLNVALTVGVGHVEMNLTGGVSVLDLSIDFLEEMKVAAGFYNIAATSPNTCRVALRYAVTCRLNVWDIIQAEGGFEFGVRFNAPKLNEFKATFERITGLITNGKTEDLKDVVRQTALEVYAHMHYRGLVQIPKIGPFGPFKVLDTSINGTMSIPFSDMILVAMSQSGDPGASALKAMQMVQMSVNARVEFLCFWGSVSMDILNPKFPPDFDAGLMTFALSEEPALGGYTVEQDGVRGSVVAGEGAYVIARSTDGDMSGHSRSARLLAAAPPPVIRASYQDGVYSYRFQIGDDGQEHAIMLTGFDWQEGGSDIRLFGPDGAPIELKPLYSTVEGVSVTAEQLALGYNAFLSDGSWLIELPRGVAGEYTLTTATPQLCELIGAPAQMKVGEIKLQPGQDGTYALDFTVDHPSGDEYYYTVDLYKDAPYGQSTDPYPVALDWSEDGAPTYRLPLPDVDQDGRAQVSHTLEPSRIFGMDAPTGDYYPVVTLWREGQKVSVEGLPGLEPQQTYEYYLDKEGYQPLRFENTAMDGVKVSNLEVNQGLNGSLNVSFTGVWSNVATAGEQLLQGLNQPDQQTGTASGSYRVAVYQESGLLAKVTSDTAVDKDTGAVTRSETECVYQVEATEADTYSLDIGGLAPGEYTVEVTPDFGGVIQGTAVRSDGVELKAYTVPNVGLTINGGSIYQGHQTDETGAQRQSYELAYVTDGFSLDIEANPDNPEQAGSFTIQITDRDTGKTLYEANTRTAHVTWADLCQGLGYAAGQAPKMNRSLSLAITVIDGASQGAQTRYLSLVMENSPPPLVLDGLTAAHGGGALACPVIVTTDPGGAFTVSGYSEPGVPLTLALDGGDALDQTTAGSDGRFELKGTLSGSGLLRSAAPAPRRVNIMATGRSGLMSAQPIDILQADAASVTALELSPAATLSLIQGQTYKLSVRATYADGTQALADPQSLGLTFVVEGTGTSAVASDGTLTAGLGTNTVRVKNGTGVISGALTVTAEKAPEPTQPSGSGGGSSGPSFTDKAVSAIKKAKDGDTVKLDLPAGGRLPGKVLEAVAGTDITLEINAGKGAVWIIKGRDILTGKLSDLNLKLETNANTIPVTVLNAFAGEQKVVQLALSHSGPFPFPLTLRLETGRENAGLFANLYYYDEIEKTLNYQSAATISPDGTTDIPFAHASSYAVIIDAASHASVTWENPFADVTEDDWFYGAVAYVSGAGLMRGTSEAAFSPDVTMNRAMLWTVLARLDGQDTEGGATWYEKGRDWAMAAGVSDGADPEGPVTREQVAAMLYRYAEAKGADVSGRADLSMFYDASSVSAWATEALAWANAGGIVTGKPGGLLDPLGKATRAEVAAVLHRFMERISAG